MNPKVKKIIILSSFWILFISAFKNFFGVSFGSFIDVLWRWLSFLGLLLLLVAFIIHFFKVFFSGFQNTDHQNNKNKRLSAIFSLLGMGVWGLAVLNIDLSFVPWLDNVKFGGVFFLIGFVLIVYSVINLLSLPLFAKLALLIIGVPLFFWIFLVIGLGGVF